MNLDRLNLDRDKYQKQIRFFKINPTKKLAETNSPIDPFLQNLTVQLRNVHYAIRKVLKDYQYFASYRKQQINLTEGERVLRMNGVKIIKENDTFFVQKYITKQQNLINRVFNQKAYDKSEILKIQFYRTQTITDPRYFLSLLGYSTKQNNYFQYLELQCYKCPSYGIQIVIYQKRDQFQYIMIQSVCNYEGNNLVAQLLVEKLTDHLTQEAIIDPYTLRPHNLKHGPLPQS